MLLIKAANQDKTRLNQIVEATKQQVRRNIILFKLSTEEAFLRSNPEKIWDAWSNEQLYCLFINNPGLHKIRVEGQNLNLRQLMTVTLKKVIDIAIRNDLTLAEILSNKDNFDSETMLNYPTEHGIFCKSTLKEVKQTVEVLKSESFYSLLTLSGKNASSCNSVLFFLISGYIQDNLYIYLESDNLKRTAQRNIALSKKTGGSYVHSNLFDINNARSVQDAKLKSIVNSRMTLPLTSQVKIS